MSSNDYAIKSMSRGFILIEALIAIAFSGFVFLMIFSLSSIVLRLPKPFTLSQLDIFSLQFDQLITYGSNFKISEQGFCFNMDVRSFCIIEENQKIIKKPGYEILLDNVRDCLFEFNESVISLKGVYENRPFSFIFEIP